MNEELPAALDQALDRFRGRTHATRDMVAVGLTACAYPQDIHEAIPDVSIQFKPAGTQFEPDVAARNFPMWLLGHAFNDVVESVHNFLDDVNGILTSALRAKKVPVPNQVSTQRFQRQGLADKATSVGQMYNLDLGPLFFRSILDMNGVRNCLTHRQGRVGDADIKRPGGVLQLRYHSLDGSVTQDSGKERYSVVLGRPVRTWHRDDRIELCAADFTNVTYTAFLFGLRTVRGVLTSAWTFGLVATKPPPMSEPLVSFGSYPGPTGDD